MEKFVDVKRLIKSKNPSLLKWLPGFFIRWIKKIIHEDDVNNFIEKHKNASSLEFSKALVEEFQLEVHFSGIENIPSPPQPIIFVSNHPLGGLDAITVIAGLESVRPDVKFIVNDLLMAVKTLQDRFVGVNKVGKNALTSLQQVEQQFAEGTATFLFPSGLVSRKINGEIRDLEWKKTFISKAKKYQTTIVPVHMGGRLTNRFYRLASLRKFLGIKFNIEMFFLVDEFFKQKNMRIDITFGKVILPETFTKEKSDKEWAAWVKELVYKLK